MKHEVLEDLVFHDLGNALDKAKLVFGERKSLKAMDKHFAALMKAVHDWRREYG